MTTHPPTRFDDFAEDYDEVLDKALSASGENRYYFLHGRIRWLVSCLQRLQEHPRIVLDYGCGTGAASSLFINLLDAEFVMGVDVSPKSLAVARQTFGSPRTQFLLFDQYQPREQVDLVYCNGVFHHIPPRERGAALDYIYRSLRPGGLFAFWENNPWNPGTRYLMARCPFDDEAITLSVREARRLLRTIRFHILRTDFLFVFPRRLKWLRALEPFITGLPLGGQYQVLCRKPAEGVGGVG